MSDAVSGFLAAVVGLAIVAVIVSNRSNSASVISTAGNGFAALINTALGNAASTAATAPFSSAPALISNTASPVEAGNVQNFANWATGGVS